MAQRRYRGTYRRALRRWGFGTGAAVTVALMTLALGAGAVGLIRQQEGVDMLVERAAPEAGEREELSQEAPESATGQAERPEPASFVVHVDGAVSAPGVVHVEGEDVRVYDAVDAAGGLLEDADTSSVNLAESLVDGAKIHIPHQGEEQQAEQATLPAGQTSTAGATGGTEAVALVNINLADEAELQTLTGVGEVTARAIIEEREQNGPYASPEDLMRVSGIGEKKFEKVRGQICV